MRSVTGGLKCQASRQLHPKILQHLLESDAANLTNQIVLIIQ